MKRLTKHSLMYTTPMTDLPEYLDLDFVLDIFEIERVYLLELINTEASTIYARPLPLGTDGQPRFEIHLDSLRATLNNIEIGHQYGYDSAVMKMAYFKALQLRIRIAQADGQPVTDLESKLADATDLADQQFTQLYGRPPRIIKQDIGNEPPTSDTRNTRASIAIIAFVVLASTFLVWRCGLLA